MGPGRTSESLIRILFRRRKRGKFAAWAAGLTLFFFCTGLSAEIIYLKNGEVVIGAVVGQDRTQMRIRTTKGLRVLTKASIRRVSYSKAEEQRLLRRQQDAERRKQEAERRKQAAAERARRESVETNEGESRPSEPITPGGLVLRSAMLPGLGHIAMDKNITGVTYMGLSGLALANLIVSRNGALAAESQNTDDVVLNLLLTFVPNGIDSLSRIGINFYLNSVAQEPYSGAIQRYDQSILLFSGIYLFQLAHIIYDALVQRPAEAPAGTGLNLNSGWDFNFAPALPVTGRSVGTKSSVEFVGNIRYTYLF